MPRSQALHLHHCTAQHVIAMVLVQRLFRYARLTLEDVQDRLHLLATGGAELVARFLNPGPELLADFRDLRFLLVREVQVLRVGDGMGLPIADLLLALILELTELLLLTR